MKKIGLLFGMEKSFPEAVCNYINEIGAGKVIAEYAKIGPYCYDSKNEYDVIFDLVSNEVPFYRSVLKQFAVNNVKIVNNPFFSTEDDEFLHNSLAKINGFPVPKTVIIPSKEHPFGTCSETFQNLIYPIDWDGIFDYIGFPAIIKPNYNTPLQNSFKIYNKNEFFAAFDNTGNNLMVLQECINYDNYYRCFTIGKKQTKITEYNPMKPHHLRYSSNSSELPENLKNKMAEYSNKISTFFDFDFNAIEFALNDDQLFIIDFLNPAPSCQKSFLKKEVFEWLVENTSKMLIEKTKQKSKKQIFPVVSK